MKINKNIYFTYYIIKCNYKISATFFDFNENHLISEESERVSRTMPSQRERDACLDQYHAIPLLLI